VIRDLTFPLNKLEAQSSEKRASMESYTFDWSGDLKTMLPYLKTTPYYWENKEGHQYLGLGKASPLLSNPLKNEALFYFYSQDFEGKNIEQIVCECQIQKIGNLLTISICKEKSWEEYFDFNKAHLGPIPLSNFIESPIYNTWEDRVHKALKNIESGYFSKVVLARKLVTDFKDNCPYHYFHLLSQNQKNTFKVTFPNKSNAIFQSFTPESLLKIKDHTLYLEAIAGTRPLGKINSQNLLWREELLTSDKEQREHQAVVNLIIETANPLGEVRKGDLEVLELKGLQHLKTPITVKLKSWNIESLNNLIQTLHPTPAVCGTPTDKAFDFIKNNEVGRTYS
jgi:isochorismate synthase EntC